MPKLGTLASTINYPYLVMREQKNKLVVRDILFAPNQKTALSHAIKAKAIGTVLLSVQRLYNEY